MHQNSHSLLLVLCASLDAENGSKCKCARAQTGCGVVGKQLEAVWDTDGGVWQRVPVYQGRRIGAPEGMSIGTLQQLQIAPMFESEALFV